MSMVRIQTAPVIDGIDADPETGDLHTRSQLPYPFFADEKTGECSDRSIHRGYRILGFQKDLAVQHVDLWWPHAMRDPKQIIGMYVVTVDPQGGMAVWQTGITDVEVVA